MKVKNKNHGPRNNGLREQNLIHSIQFENLILHIVVIPSFFSFINSKNSINQYNLIHEAMSCLDKFRHLDKWIMKIINIFKLFNKLIQINSSSTLTFCFEKKFIQTNLQLHLRWKQWIKTLSTYPYLPSSFLATLHTDEIPHNMGPEF